MNSHKNARLTSKGREVMGAVVMARGGGGLAAQGRRRLPFPHSV